MSRPLGTAAELERRRKQAVRAAAGGQSRQPVAEVLGVHYKAVARWGRSARRPGGVDAKPPPAPAPGLTDADRRGLAGLLARGAEAHGRHNELRTAARLSDRPFDTSDHPEHVRKALTRRLGWASRTPRRKARGPDDKGAARGGGGEFPRIVRPAWERKAYLAFLDEPGSFLTPVVRRPPAPTGEWPVLDARDRRDRWSASSSITLSPVAGRPGLDFDLLGHHVRPPDVVAEQVEWHRRVGRGTAVWGRNRIRSGSEGVRAWLAKHPGVVVGDFPGYVPDLNPDEGAWGWAECGRLANRAATDRGESWDRVGDELVEVKFRPDLLRGLVQQTGLPGVTLAA